MALRPTLSQFLDRLCTAVVYPLRREPALCLALALLALAGPLAAVAWNLFGLHTLVHLTDKHLPNMAMGLLLSYPWAYAAAWAGRCWVRVTVISLNTLPALLQMWLLLTFRQTVNPVTVGMVLETNSQETLEFCGLYLTSWRFLGLLMGCAALVAGSELLRNPLRRIVSNLAPTCWTCAAALVAVTLLYGAVYQTRHLRLAFCSNFNQLTHCEIGFRLTPTIGLGLSNTLTNRLLYVVGWYRCSAAEWQAQSVLTQQVLQQTSPPRATATDSLTIMVVIGESHVLHRSQLYGYPLANEPWLTSERDSGRLVAFEDAVSCGTTTFVALRPSMLVAEPGGGGVLYSAVLKSVGWHTTLVERQTGANDKGKTNPDLGLLGLLFPLPGSTAPWDYSFADCVPDDTVPLPLPALGKPLLMMHHLRGQHSPYKYRYPATPQWQRFTADDIADNGRPWMTEEKRQCEAEYANATFYNDRVLQSLAETLRGTDAIMIYYGDHGDEVYDYRDYQGRVLPEPGLERDFLLCEARVPVVMWWTEQFARLHPATVASIRNAKERPLTTGLLGQTILGIASYEGPWRDASKDFLSTQYQTPHRIVNDTYDYDAIVQGREK